MFGTNVLCSLLDIPLRKSWVTRLSKNSFYLSTNGWYTFRHDLKIKDSDEWRVMKTAAAFAKGLLQLEGDLLPILVSLVHKENGSMHILATDREQGSEERFECLQREEICKSHGRLCRAVGI